MPDFVNLKPFAGQVANVLVMIGLAGFPDLDEDSRDGVFHTVAKPGGPANRIAFNKASNDLSTLLWG